MKNRPADARQRPSDEDPTARGRRAEAVGRQVTGTSRRVGMAPCVCWSLKTRSRSLATCAEAWRERRGGRWLAVR